MFFRKRKKKEKEVEKVTTESLIKFLAVEDDSDQYITSLANDLLSGIPLVLHFAKLNNIDGANKIISFISGVVYAVGGHIVEINPNTYLFTDEKAFEDGTLDSFLKQIK